MPKNGFIMRFFGCAQLPVGVVGVPRRSTENGGFKPFIVTCAQKNRQYKKPAEPFKHWLRGLLYAWWSNGGQNELGEEVDIMELLPLYAGHERDAFTKVAQIFISPLYSYGKSEI